MKRINLLPPEQQVRASRERGLMYIIVFLVAVVAVLGLVYFQQRSQVSSKQDELAGLQAQTAAVQAQIAALQPYAQIEAARTTMTETTKSIYGSRVNWSTVFEQVSLVIPENVRLNTMNCVVPATMLPGAAADAGTSTADVTFTGLTYTPDDVATFMTRLGLIPQLTDIQLTSSTRTTASGGESTSTGTSSTSSAGYRWQFTITATLRPYLTAPPTTTLTEAAQ
jgi:Tfp pilus assembly protein PilN